jgi:hypothetical protein
LKINSICHAFYIYSLQASISKDNADIDTLVPPRLKMYSPELVTRKGNFSGAVEVLGRAFGSAKKGKHEKKEIFLTAKDLIRDNALSLGSITPA